MVTRFVLAAAFGLLALSASSADDGERHFKVILPRGLGVIESVTVYQTKDGKREPVAEIKKFDKPVELPNDGPFEVFVKPKSGIAVRAIEKLTVKASKTHEFKIGNVLGAVEVVGDDLPRAEKIVLTDVKDPGPGEKGHVAVQVASDYRVDMLAPPGAYAVWVVPANGAKAQRVVDNVRVQAGRNVRVGD
jgi:hypothetical protein